MDQKKFEEFIDQHANYIFTREANVRGRLGNNKVRRHHDDQMIITELKPSADPCGTCHRMRPDHVRFDVIWSRTAKMWIWKCQSCSRQTNPATGLIEPRNKQHANDRPRDPVTGRLIKSV